MTAPPGVSSLTLAFERIGSAPGDLCRSATACLVRWAHYLRTIEQIRGEEQESASPLTLSAKVQGQGFDRRQGSHRNGHLETIWGRGFAFRGQQSRRKHQIWLQIMGAMAPS